MRAARLIDAYRLFGHAAAIWLDYKTSTVHVDPSLF
jgi:hypothetical protein